MANTTALHVVLSHELDTQELNLEHDTLVVTPEFSRRVVAALHELSSQADSAGAQVIEFPAPISC